MKKKVVTLLLASSISVLTFVVYLPALGNSFVEWDDSLYVYENFKIQSLNIAFLKWAFSTFDASNWHPLTWISHAVDYAIWGLNPFGHHLTNNILHAVNTLLVVLLVARLIRLERRPGGDLDAPLTLRFSSHNSQYALITAGLTGILFGLHPLHVESAVWVAERKDLLCAFFYLLSVTMYASYATHKVHKQETSYRRYFLALVLFALALLSKPMAVSLPIVILILDWYPFGRMPTLKTAWRVIGEKLPFMALAICSAVVTIIAQSRGGAMLLTEVLPLSTRLLVAAKSLMAYLWNMVLPSRLIPYYPYPGDISMFSPDYALPLAAVVFMSAASFVAARNQRFWLALWSYYVITLVPVLGIVQVGAQAMADRYVYLPGIGPFLLAGSGGAWCFLRMKERGLRYATVFAASGAVLLIVSLSYLTIQQIGVWRDSINLWTYVIEKSPERIAVAFNNRGLAFMERGELQRAAEDFQSAVETVPSHYEAYANRCRAYILMNKFEKAMDDCNKALSLHSSHKIYYLRGILFEKQGLFNSAIEDYQSAVAINQSFLVAYITMGVLYGKTGSLDKSIETFDRALQFDPTYPQAYGNRGFAYYLKGETGKALHDLDKAVALDKDYANAYMNRAAVFLKTGDRERAVADFQKACSLGVEEGCTKAQEDRQDY